MRDLRESRAKFITALIVLLLLDAGAGAYLILGPKPGTRRDEVEQLRRELQSKRAQTEPLKNIDKKLEQAQRDIRSFARERLPQTYSEVSEQLGKLAREHSVDISEVRYEPGESGVPEFARVRVTSTLAGDYVRVVRYINALERSKLFFVVNRVDLADQQGGMVKLGLEIETYLKRGGLYESGD
jgi:hypothetical protein